MRHQTSTCPKCQSHDLYEEFGGGHYRCRSCHWLGPAVELGKSEQQKKEGWWNERITPDNPLVNTKTMIVCLAIGIILYIVGFAMVPDIWQSGVVDPMALFIFFTATAFVTMPPTMWYLERQDKKKEGKN